jgi:hypothetical protein
MVQEKSDEVKSDFPKNIYGIDIQGIKKSNGNYLTFNAAEPQKKKMRMEVFITSDGYNIA